VRLIAQSRDAGRERMLIGVLRSLGAVSEGSTANAAKVIAARGVVPAFQLLGSRLPAVRQVRAAQCPRERASSLTKILTEIHGLGDLTLNWAAIKLASWPRSSATAVMCMTTGRDMFTPAAGGSVHAGVPVQRGRGSRRRGGAHQHRGPPHALPRRPAHHPGSRARPGALADEV
jgi:hypothetical protein